MKPKHSVRTMLKYIYKAEQCTDLVDVECALLSLKELYSYHNFIGTYTMNRRLSNLTKRRDYFINKQK